MKQFVTDLQLLARDCAFKEPDEMIRDRIVFGTNSHKIREKLINQGKDLTLHKAAEIARTYELSRAQLAVWLEPAILLPRKEYSHVANAEFSCKRGLSCYGENMS